MDSTTNTKQNILQTVPFFMVTDMEASLKFYTEKLGFAITNTWVPRGKIEWCWLQRENANIMLQEPRNLNDLANHKKGAGVSICYQCVDALALYHEFLEKEVPALPEPFVGNNFWVVEISDPDGYKLFFESPTEVPEETTYSAWKQRQH